MFKICCYSSLYHQKRIQIGPEQECWSLSAFFPHLKLSLKMGDRGWYALAGDDSSLSSRAGCHPEGAK